MAGDSVEREILIEATPDVVWGVITEPEQIVRWFSDEADVQARASAEGTLTWKPGGRGGGDRQSDLVVPIWVVDAEPFHRFSFRWNHPDGSVPDASNSALVEFLLTPEGESRTRLRVVESGIDAVAPDQDGRASYREDHEGGWARHFDELLAYVEQRRS